MDTKQVTEQILSAWEEVQAEEQAATEEPTSEETPPDIAPEEEEQPEVEEGDEPADEEAEEEAEAGETEEDDGETEEGETEEEEAEVAAYRSDDLEVTAFLAKYGGDVDKALKGAAEIYRLFGKQANEKSALAQQVEALTAELEQARAFAPTGSVLNDEQREWVASAVESGQPAAYVNQAVQEGMYDLARAVCQEWAREDPYSALRAGQYVDQAEAAIQNYVEPIDMGQLLEALKTEIPDLPNYSAQMTQVLATLGDNHPLVQDARSSDLGTAARGIVGIYELARASSVTVTAARQKVVAEQRQNGAAAKAKAVVSSAAASPSAPETPRTATKLGPGLTLEQLEAEFARQ